MVHLSTPHNLFICITRIVIIRDHKVSQFYYLPYFHTVNFPQFYYQNSVPPPPIRCELRVVRQRISVNGRSATTHRHRDAAGQLVGEYINVVLYPTHTKFRSQRRMVGGQPATGRPAWRTSKSGRTHGE